MLWCVAELVVARVGHAAGQGLFTCIRDPQDLTYTAVVMIETPSGNTEVSCSGDLHWEMDENRGDIYCLPPCPGTEDFPYDHFYLVVTGRDSINPQNVIAFAEEDVTFMSKLVVGLAEYFHVPEKKKNHCNTYKLYEVPSSECVQAPQTSSVRVL